MMKKTVTKPDGSSEVIEGTADEIAEYERKLRQGPLKEAPPKKKEILKGSEDSFVELMRKLMEETRRNEQIYNPTPYLRWGCPGALCNPFCVKCNGGPWWGIVPPTCVCGSSFFTYTTQTTIPRQTMVRIGDIGDSIGISTTGYLADALSDIPPAYVIEEVEKANEQPLREQPQLPLPVPPSPLSPTEVGGVTGGVIKVSNRRYGG